MLPWLSEDDFSTIMEKHQEKGDHDLLVEIRSKIEGLEKCEDDHERRIRLLEKFTLRIAGVGGLLAFVTSGGIISMVIWLVSG